MWNQMEINWHLVTLFTMQYKHLMDGINHDFMSSHIKKLKSATVSMNTVSIPNISIKFWTCKSEFSLIKFLCSLTPPKITRQRPFELTYIDYDLIKDEIGSMERVE